MKENPAMIKSSISRRGMLRGAGVALTLPWLETLAAAEPAGRGSQAATRKRFVCLFMGNGVSAGHWWAKGDGPTMELSNTLSPLAEYRTHLNVLQGLHNPNGASGEQHVDAAPVILSCGVSDKKGIGAATSFDQVLASRSSKEADFPSLVLGVEAANLGRHHGRPLIYSGHISWSTPTTPVPRENDPRVLYRRLVGDPAGLRSLRSVLDLVLEDAKNMKARLSAGDRQRLDQYLTQVREIEQRLERPKPSQAAGVPQVADLMQPPPSDPVDNDIRTRLMIDLIAVALQSGKTDVVTLMFQNDLSTMDVSFVGGSSPALRDHHGLSHYAGPDYQRVNQYYVQRYADLVGKLAATQEGDRSLLDSSVVMFCSSLFSGGSHDKKQLPILLAGGAGGGLKTGRVLSYPKEDEGARRISNLYLSLHDFYGIDADRFADSTGRLANL
jgi:hypothetical protein